MQTMTRDLIKHYSGQMESLIETLKFFVSSMTLTSDIWSGRDKEDCIGIVAHYMNYDWGLEKRLLGLRSIEDAHIGFNIAKHVAW